jgi:hypothetical protein
MFDLHCLGAGPEGPSLVMPNSLDPERAGGILQWCCSSAYLASACE